MQVGARTTTGAVPLGIGNRSGNEGLEATIASVLQVRGHPSGVTGDPAHNISARYLRVRGPTRAVPVELLDPHFVRSLMACVSWWDNYAAWVLHTRWCW